MTEFLASSRVTAFTVSESIERNLLNEKAKGEKRI